MQGAWVYEWFTVIFACLSFPVIFILCWFLFLFEITLSETCRYWWWPPRRKKTKALDSGVEKSKVVHFIRRVFYLQMSYFPDRQAFYGASRDPALEPKPVDLQRPEVLVLHLLLANGQRPSNLSLQCSEGWGCLMIAEAHLVSTMSTVSLD